MPGLLRHVTLHIAFSPFGPSADLTRKTDQTFSTWAKSSSTGVLRPKMVTETRTLLFS